MPVLNQKITNFRPLVVKCGYKPQVLCGFSLFGLQECLSIQFQGFLVCSGQEFLWVTSSQEPHGEILCMLFEVPQVQIVGLPTLSHVSIMVRPVQVAAGHNQ